MSIHTAADYSQVPRYKKDFFNYVEKCVNLSEIHSLKTLDSHMGRVMKIYIQNIRNLLGTNLQDYLLQALEMPDRVAKDLQKSINVYAKMSRAPNKPGTWWEKNLVHTERIMLALVKYKEVDLESSEWNFNFEGFDVYNTVRANGRDLNSALEVIKKAKGFMMSSRIPIMSKMFYGDLNLVNRLRGKKVLAWYHLADDKVFLRVDAKGSDVVHTLIHELGHRWWNRFMKVEDQRSWIQHHRRIAASRTKTPLPKVGDLIPFKIKGMEDPRVVKVQGLYIYLSDTQYITVKQFQKAAQKLNFPTNYASTDAQEHFCEAFAMYCMGTLSDDHRKSFDSIILSKMTLSPEIEIKQEPKPDPEVIQAPKKTSEQEKNFDAIIKMATKNFSTRPLDVKEGVGSKAAMLHGETPNDRGDKIRYHVKLMWTGDFTMEVKIRPSFFETTPNKIIIDIKDPRTALDELRKVIYSYLTDLVDMTGF
jgi:hypothetical protein